MNESSKISRRWIFGAALVIGVIALYLSWKGLGVPNHVYQAYLALLVVGVAYHRRWIKRPRHWYEMLLVLTNVFLLCILLKLFIGSGSISPLAWFKYPHLITEPQQKWIQVLPSLGVQWEATPWSNWEIDLTKLQTFLLFLTLLGGMIRFQPFASFTALALLFLSLPAFGRFEWEFVFPALVTSFVHFYLQTSDV
jgi:hypothetical protein